MPCSRSARRPSVRSARFTYPSPRRSDVSSTCSSWSSKIDFVSYSSRPISVDLPSSTEPAVAKRTSSEVRGIVGRPLVAAPVAVAITRTGGSRPRTPDDAWPVSEIPLLLAVLHGRLRDPVVGARLAALGDPSGGDLRHHRLERLGRRGDGARTAHVAHRAEAHGLLERLLAGQQLDKVGDRVEHAVAAEHAPLVREVDAG